MTEIIKNYFKQCLDPRNMPYPFGKTTAMLLSIFTSVIGLVAFSYFVQNDTYFYLNYDDFRRIFTLWAFIAILVGSIIYSIPYIINLSKNYEPNPINKAISIILSIILYWGILFILFVPPIDLLLKSKPDFSQEHEKQKIMSVITSIILIMGSTFPLLTAAYSNLLPHESLISTLNFD